MFTFDICVFIGIYVFVIDIHVFIDMYVFIVDTHVRVYSGGFIMVFDGL